jgi:hypothetical protein
MKKTIATGSSILHVTPGLLAQNGMSLVVLASTIEIDYPTEPFQNNRVQPKENLLFRRVHSCFCKPGNNGSIPVVAKFFRLK